MPTQGHATLENYKELKAKSLERQAKRDLAAGKKVEPVAQPSLGKRLVNKLLRRK